MFVALMIVMVQGSGMQIVIVWIGEALLRILCSAASGREAVLAGDCLSSDMWDPQRNVRRVIIESCATKRHEATFFAAVSIRCDMFE